MVRRRAAVRFEEGARADVRRSVADMPIARLARVHFFDTLGPPAAPRSSRGFLPRYLASQVREARSRPRRRASQPFGLGEALVHHAAPASPRQPIASFLPRREGVATATAASGASVSASLLRSLACRARFRGICAAERAPCCTRGRQRFCRPRRPPCWCLAAAASAGAGRAARPAAAAISASASPCRGPLLLRRSPEKSHLRRARPRSMTKRHGACIHAVELDDAALGRRSRSRHAASDDLARARRRRRRCARRLDAERDRRRGSASAAQDVTPARCRTAGPRARPAWRTAPRLRRSVGGLSRARDGALLLLRDVHEIVDAAVLTLDARPGLKRGADNRVPCATATSRSACRPHPRAQRRRHKDEADGFDNVGKLMGEPQRRLARVRTMPPMTRSTMA